DANMVVVNKGNVGDGNIVHKAIVSYTSLVDKDLIDNVVEIRDMDMLVVDNVVNSNLADNCDMGSETESDESERKESSKAWFEWIKVKRWFGQQGQFQLEASIVGSKIPVEMT
ncbi:hypothetical protein Tco_0356838, partial [Tanacetum coccineum]